MENEKQYSNTDVSKFVFANDWYYDVSDNSCQIFLNYIKELARFCQLFGIVIECTYESITNEIRIDVGDMGMTNIRNILESLELFLNSTTTTDICFTVTTDSVWKNEKFSPILTTEIILPTETEQMMKNKTTMIVRTTVDKPKDVVVAGEI